MNTNCIKNWQADDRPREKMLTHGVSILSNAELLAILINNGTKNQSAVDLAKNLLQQTDNSFIKLSTLSVKEILQLKIKGIGPAKAITIVAALEMANRRPAQGTQKQKITNSQTAANIFLPKLKYKKIEEFWIMFLNVNHTVIALEQLSIGGIKGTVVDVKVILQKAILQQASSLILCHNHPSGNLNPSSEDKSITQKIAQAAKLLELKVIDHIIVSDEGYYSFADNKTDALLLT